MKDLKINIKNTFLFILLITFIIFGLQIISSVSANCETFYIAQTPDFLNIAKSMLHGSVLYTDVSDHKGIYTFIPFLFANLFSDPALVVQIMEQIIYLLIIGSCILFYKNQTKNDITKTLKRTLIFTVIFTFFTGKCTAWLIAEGFLCIVLFWLFIYINNISNGMEINKKQFLFWGIIIGFFLFSKYTIILYFIPYFTILITELIKRRVNKKNVLFFILHGIYGVFLASIIPLLYCIINNNFGDMAEAMSGCISEDKIIIILVAVGCGLICCILASQNHYNNNVDKRNIYILLASFLLNFASLSIINYLITPYVVILHCVRYKTERKRSFSLITRVSFLIILLMTMLNIHSIITTIFIYEPQIKSTRDLADTHDINNSNILYMADDVGFGSWSDEVYKIKYQWIPRRFYETEKGLIYLKRNLELIRNNEFKYVYFMMPEDAELKYFYNNELMNEYKDIFVDIQNELKLNYYMIEPDYCPIYRSKAYIETID